MVSILEKRIGLTTPDQGILPTHNPHQPVSRSSELPRRPLIQRSLNGTHIFEKQEAKNHMLAMVSEYVGTTLFLMLAFGGTAIANNTTYAVIPGRLDTSALLYISLSFGLSLMVNAWVFFRVSGGLFNPAVSLGLALIGAISPLRAVLLSAAQFLGGITAAGLTYGLLPIPLACRTTLSGGISLAQGFFLEMFMTFILMITILLLAAEKHKATYLAPIGIGAALFMGEMVSVPFTGGALNPARAFGPEVVNKTFAKEHWIYFLAPCLGSALASGFYRFLKLMKYETCNPDQDAASVFPLHQSSNTRQELSVADAQQHQDHPTESWKGTSSVLFSPLDSADASTSSAGTKNSTNDYKFPFTQVSPSPQPGSAHLEHKIFTS